MKSKIHTPLAGQNIITRGLPKTGQVISYSTGDDGWWEAGWWKGRLNANNRTRFLAKSIDLSLSNQFPEDFQNPANWSNLGPIWSMASEQLTHNGTGMPPPTAYTAGAPWVTIGHRYRIKVFCVETSGTNLRINLGLVGTPNISDSTGEKSFDTAPATNNDPPSVACAGFVNGNTVLENLRIYDLDAGVDDVVVDRATGLMWAADGTAKGCNNGVADDWTEAVAFGRNLVFAGFDDWRLPNIRELASLLDYSQNPVQIYVFFPNTAEAGYWSSTSAGIVFGDAWRVSFGAGDIDYIIKTSNLRMRGVRGGI